VERLVRVLALSVYVGLAAGCGGSSLQAIGHKQAKDYGASHAAITRVERVQVVGGGKPPWAIILMKSRSPFRLGCSSEPFNSRHIGALGFLACHPRYAAFGVKPGSHTAQISWGLSSSQIAAIARARRARRSFRIFPDLTSVNVRCSIPRGGPPGGTVTGTCTTGARPPNHVRRVEFMEIWPPNWTPAGWVVTLSRSGRVQSIRVIGQPPQLTK
jgi:hypothetical protein